MFNFDVFYKNNFPRIRGYAYTFGLQRSDCEDVSQEVLTDFWHKIEDGRANPSDEGVHGYLNKLARWRITDKARKNYNLQKNYDQIGEENNLDELPSKMEQDDWRIDFLKKAARNTKSKIKPREYKYFYEMTFEGKTSEDICNTYGIKKAYAYLTKHRVGNKVIETAKQLLSDGIQHI